MRPPGDPAALERGLALYKINCAFCHGQDARGGDGGPSLLRSGLVLADQNGELIGPVLEQGRGAHAEVRLQAGSGRPTSPCSCTRSASPATTSRVRSRRRSSVETPRRARRSFSEACCRRATPRPATCRASPAASPTSASLQQSWLMPGSMAGRGAPPPARATASHRHRDRAGPGARDRHARPHRRFRGVAHHRGRRVSVVPHHAAHEGRGQRSAGAAQGPAPQMHGRGHPRAITAFSGDPEMTTIGASTDSRRGARPRRDRRALCRPTVSDPGADPEAARRLVADVFRRLLGPPLQRAHRDQPVEREAPGPRVDVAAGGRTGLRAPALPPPPFGPRPSRNDRRRRRRQRLRRAATVVKGGGARRSTACCHVTRPTTCGRSTRRTAASCGTTTGDARGGTHIGNRGAAMWRNYLFFVTPDDYLDLARRADRARSAGTRRSPPSTSSSFSTVGAGRRRQPRDRRHRQRPRLARLSCSRSIPRPASCSGSCYTVPMNPGDPGLETWKNLDAARQRRRASVAAGRLRSRRRASTSSAPATRRRPTRPRHAAKATTCSPARIVAVQRRHRQDGVVATRRRRTTRTTGIRRRRRSWSTARSTASRASWW